MSWTRPRWVAWLCAGWLLGACTGQVDDARHATSWDTHTQAASTCAPGSLSGAGGAPDACGQLPAECTGGVCSCAPGLSNCYGSCVDVTSDALHCGACDRACAAGSTCSAGQCGCPPGTSPCNGACLDTQTDRLNCGGCGVACVAGQVCDAGRCVAGNSAQCTSVCGAGRECLAGACACPASQSFCTDTCADTQTSIDHCGACEHACLPGELCSAGSCVCPGGQTEWDGACVDTQTSLLHCGGCGQVCAAGESCTAGACRGAVGADGCSGSARGISLGEIAAYQSLKIPIMQNLTSVAPGARVADVVQGRETLFRVFVQPEAGFVARELSARLTLINGNDHDQYFAKQTLREASTDEDSASTFMIFAPADKIQADTRYAVELVECGADPGTGNMVAPRFPESGDEALGARETGTLKIAIVPVATGSYVPDTSDAALEVYREYFLAMYPITSIELTVTSQITTPSPVNWNNLLEQVRSKRQSDAPPGDVYYYGFIKPAATLRDFCRSSCTAGVGYVASSSQAGTRAAVGLAFADATSASTMAHEVGHNHGRNHAPCAPGNNISGVDTKYPYVGATLGSWGYDHRRRLLLDPQQGTDIMGYCNMKWVSDYTYRGLTDRVATVNANYDRFVAPELVASYRVLLLDQDGPRWSFPIDQPSEPFGEPLTAEVLDAYGTALTHVTVYRTEIGDTRASSFIVLVPEPQLGWSALRVPGWPAIGFAETIGVPAR